MIHWLIKEKPNMQYSEPTIYGMNLILKDYARFPRILPLPCHLEHGWTPQTPALASDLEVNKPLMLVFSQRRLEAWKKANKTPAYIMGAPFIHYRKMHKIAKKSDAKGTVAFPCHSTEDIKSSFDIKKYCKELSKLPRKFHPITVCLFWPDYIDKSADIYRETGLMVVTAGRKYKKGLSFVKNFYKILSKHRYATSNEVGSLAFYAVEFKIPFFLLGESPLVVNIGSNKDADAIERTDEKFYGKKAIKMFATGPTDQITPKQAEFVSKEIGEGDCLSPLEANKLLWNFFRKDKKRIGGILAYWSISVLLSLNLADPAVSTIKKFRKTSRQSREIK